MVRPATILYTDFWELVAITHVANDHIHFGLIDLSLELLPVNLLPLDTLLELTQRRGGTGIQCRARKLFGSAACFRSPALAS